MSEENNNLEVTPEEQKAEAEAQSEVNEDELRTKLAGDLGIDPNEETELLDKLVAREKTQRERLSGAIKQKISWREKAKNGTSGKPTATPPAGTPQQNGQGTPDFDAMVDQKLNERLEARDLDSLGLEDDVKQQVRDLAKLKGIPVRIAAQDPYIKHVIEEKERAQRIQDATPKRRNGGTYRANYDPSKPLNPSDFDLGSEEGRKAWQDAKAARRQHTQQ